MGKGGWGRWGWPGPQTTPPPPPPEVLKWPGARALSPQRGPGPRATPSVPQVFHADDSLPFTVDASLPEVHEGDYEAYNYMEPEEGAVKDEWVDLDTGRHVYIKTAYTLNHPDTWRYHRQCMGALRPRAEAQAAGDALPQSHACQRRSHVGACGTAPDAAPSTTRKTHHCTEPGYC